MLKVHLRKVGGSVMLAVPRMILESLNLDAGSVVDLALEDGRLVVGPERRPRYTLAELLAQCDATAADLEGERAWTAGPLSGRELI